MFSEEYVESLKQDPNYELVRRMKEQADAAPESETATCMNVVEQFGRHRLFYVIGDRALMPGHIYSRAGLDEANMTRMCEFCFDAATTDDGEEP